MACAHCGLAVPAGLLRDGEKEQFCCSGCRQVYTLVREWGFDQYYRLVDQQQGALEPARVTGRSFEDFDDAQLQAEATEAVGADRCRTRLYLEGVHCPACVWLVERLPAALPGVDEIRLNLGSSVAEVTWEPGKTRLSAVGRALDRLGYTPHVHRAARVQEARRAEDRTALARLGVAAACAMNLMFLSGALYAGEASGMASAYESFFRWFSFAVSVPVALFSARPFFRTALAALRARTVHIHLPIAVAIAVGFAASTVNVVRGSGPLWFDSLAMLVAALLGAQQVQRGAQRAALERADSLRGAAFVEFARRLEGDGPGAPAVEVPISALSPGDRVEVRSGELVPVDGVVLVRALDARQRRPDRRDGRPAGAGRGRRQRRRDEPGRAPRRPRRRRRREDARRRPPGDRPGGARPPPRAPAARPTSSPAASSRASSSWRPRRARTGCTRAP